MRQYRALLVLAAAAALCVATPAYADYGVKAGVLTCAVNGGWGFVLGSSRTLNCTFSPDGGRTERYLGKINTYGVDLGYSAGGVMVWAVFAPTGDLAPGALQGGYGGVTGGATVGVGGYANVLVGGSANHISLQPVSLQGAGGLDVAGGVGSINLNYTP